MGLASDRLAAGASRPPPVFGDQPFGITKISRTLALSLVDTA